MNTKTIVGGVLAAIVSFLLGWLVFGILLMDYYATNMKTYEGLMKANPAIWAIAVANLCFGMMLAFIFQLGGILTASRGFVTAMIISLLVSMSFNLSMHAQFDLYSGSLLVTDVLVNMVFGGIVGAFLGWWLGRKTPGTGT
jgi:hypothetical protein